MDKKKTVRTAVLTIFCLLFWVPVLVMFPNSFMGAEELKASYGGVLGGGTEAVRLELLPVYPTLKPYVELLLDSPDFFVMFWNSVKQVVPILIGQVLIGMPAAWAFGRYRFRGRRILFLLYMILMIMPFQVTMVSSYVSYGYPPGNHPARDLLGVSRIYHAEVLSFHPGCPCGGSHGGRGRTV